MAEAASRGATRLQIRETERLLWEKADTPDNRYATKMAMYASTADAASSNITYVQKLAG